MLSKQQDDVTEAYSIWDMADQSSYRKYVEYIKEGR